MLSHHRIDFLLKGERARKKERTKFTCAFSDLLRSRSFYRKRHSDRYYREISNRRDLANSLFKLQAVETSRFAYRYRTLCASRVDNRQVYLLSCGLTIGYTQAVRRAIQSSVCMRMQTGTSVAVCLRREKMICPRALFHRRVLTSLRKLNSISPPTLHVR